MEIERLCNPLLPETAIGVKDFRTLGEKSTIIDFLFSYLFFAGYLTPLPDDRHFRLPNNEELTKKLLLYYKKSYNIEHNLFSKANFELQSVLSNKDIIKAGRLMTGFVKELLEVTHVTTKLSEEDLLKLMGDAEEDATKRQKKSCLKSKNRKER
ncbi:MAG: hypothetical protein KA007_01845 [Candidatus Pacebacteria bacterium]|jgi:hypothetical protein|nr:hypothetical protein [Candidatus Paceibacterota bacterium]